VREAGREGSAQQDRRDVQAMKAWMLGPRRLLWFLTDWSTELRFNLPCRSCGEQIVMESRGFRYPRILWHNPYCENHRWLNRKSMAHGLRCRLCRDRWRFMFTWWIVCRWRFREKYNWGVGVDPECLKGNHLWPAEPDAHYVDGETTWFTATCPRCKFSMRWGILTRWGNLV
jgi:hypothetical protein